MPKKTSDCCSSMVDKGRALDGRRAYRCQKCESSWTEGLQGVSQRYSQQRSGNQFHDTGAEKRHNPDDGLYYLNH